MTAAVESGVVNARSIVLLGVGACCLAVGATTVFLPDRARRVSQAVFPGAPDGQGQWRAVGLITAGVGLFLLSMA